MAYTTIDDPTLYFSTTLWSGNGTDDRDIVVDGTGMQPDWVWIKERTNAGYHFTFDSVRGATKNLHTNITQEESTQANALQTFNSNGFQIGNDSDINNSGDTYVSWSWLAGGSASSNTDGSITSTVSANQTSGFSVVTTTGTGSNATIGHGLGAAPAMIIGKRRDSGSSQWRVYNKNLSSNSHILFLDTADAEQGSNSATWNNTAPTSSVFSVGTSGDVNASSGTFVFYCFAEKKGFSKFGSYTGNGSTDGTFVYTGFKPAFTLIKQSSASGTWWEMVDNKRSPSNVMDNTLYANVTNTEFESSAYNRDFVSNGFKIRNTNGGDNTSGATYVYMAFAETPFVTSTGIPTTAR